MMCSVRGRCREKQPPWPVVLLAGPLRRARQSVSALEQSERPPAVGADSTFWTKGRKGPGQITREDTSGSELLLDRDQQ